MQKNVSPLAMTMPEEHALLEIAEASIK